MFVIMFGIVFVIVCHSTYYRIQYSMNSVPLYLWVYYEVYVLFSHKQEACFLVLAFMEKKEKCCTVRSFTLNLLYA